VKIRVLDNYEALGWTSSEILAEKLGVKPSSVFLVPTRVTPLWMYRRLVELRRKERLSFPHAGPSNRGR
jgi:hypothetical protein